MMLCLLFLFVTFTSAQLNYYELNNASAVCNDGSRAGFFYKEGTSSWLIIYLEGGGFCFDATSCNSRWKDSPSLMSSKYWKKTIEPGGILSSNQTINAHWFDATFVYIPYCSSDSFSGNQMKSDIGWSFMGSVIVENVVDQAISQFGISKRSNIIFTGSSAGAEGLYPNADRVSQKFPFMKFFVLLDSGWFLDDEPFRNGDCSDLSHCTEQGGLQRGVPHWNPRMNEGCAATKTQSTLWECILGYHAFPFLQVPSFVFVYGYDAAGLGHDGIYTIPSSPQELNYANEASINISKSLSAVGVTAYFKPHCYYHTIEGNSHWNQVTIDGKSFPSVAYEWTQNPTQKFQFADTCVGPNCNPTCKFL